ncbi:MAG: hypothetical protein WBN95_10670, partial [Gammaproteobacteria bacterium]
MQALSIQQADLIRILQSKYTQRAMWVINLLLIIWIASMLANLTWDLLAPVEPVDEIKVTTEMTPAPANP